MPGASARVVALQTSCASRLSGTVFDDPARVLAVEDAQVDRGRAARSTRAARRRGPLTCTPRFRSGSAGDMGSRLGRASHVATWSIYLDHAATSPLRPEVLAAYTAALRLVGNPSSIHGHGPGGARAARGGARAGSRRRSGPTRRGGAHRRRHRGGQPRHQGAVLGRRPRRLDPRRRIIVPLAEHHATIDRVEWLAAHEGAVLDWIEVDELGRIRLDALEAALAVGGDEVALVTALWANNEVGTIQPVAEIVAAAARYGVPVHLDAIAAYGSVPIDFHALGRRGAQRLGPQDRRTGRHRRAAASRARRRSSRSLHGGNQQRARSGTQDAAGAAAFGVAAELADRRAGRARRATRDLRDRLIARHPAHGAGRDAARRPRSTGRLPGNAHFTFAGCEGDSLLFLLDVAGFSVSTGSACQAGVPEASHVLLAMGLSEAEARGALRFTLGPDTTAGRDRRAARRAAGRRRAGARAGLAARQPTLGR